MRAIDADEFMKNFDKEIENGATDVFDAVENALEETPAIEPKQEWISVRDRLPEERDSIFARFYGTEKWKAGMFRTA